MMTKPPGFASSSTLPLHDHESEEESEQESGGESEEESIDESLDEILLEANERPLENPVKSLEAVPSALSDDDSDAESAPMATGEVTVLAPRPTFFDEVREEETKVDPFETAIRAAASRADGLTSQASQQRDRALRKSTSQPVLPTTRAHDESDVEFEDPDASDDSQQYGASLSGNIGERTPADIPIADDADASPPSGYLSGSASGGFQSRLPPPLRTAPPPGRPDIYPGRRIPTPSTASNTADFLPLPSGGFGSGSHYPSITIPAPVAPDSSARVAALTDSRIRLPAAGLAGFLVTAFGGGLLIGALLWRGHANPAPIQQLPVAAHTAPAMITEPVPRVVKPVTPPAPEVKPPAPAAVAAAPAPTPSMPTLAAEAAPAGSAAAELAAAPKPVKKASSATSATSTRPRKFSVADEDAILNGEDPTAPPPPKPVKKKKTTWTDPFAQ